jgi:hypothetical protein
VEVVRGERGLAVVGVEQLHPDVRLVEPLRLRVPERRLDVRAHVHRAPVVVPSHAVEDGGQVVDERPVLRLGATQCELDVLRARDVGDDAVPEPDRAIGAPEGDGRVTDPHRLAVRAHHAVLALERGPELASRPPLIADERTVVGVGLPDPELGVGQVGLERVAEQLLHLRAEVEGGGPLVVGVDVDHDGNALDQVAVQGLAPGRDPLIVVTGWVLAHGPPMVRRPGPRTRSSARLPRGRVAERTKATVLKTVSGLPTASNLRHAVRKRCSRFCALLTGDVSRRA